MAGVKSKHSKGSELWRIALAVAIIAAAFVGFFWGLQVFDSWWDHVATDSQKWKAIAVFFGSLLVLGLCFRDFGKAVFFFLTRYLFGFLALLPFLLPLIVLSCLFHYLPISQEAKIGILIMAGLVTVAVIGYVFIYLAIRKRSDEDGVMHRFLRRCEQHMPKPILGRTWWLKQWRILRGKDGNNSEDTK